MNNKPATWKTAQAERTKTDFALKQPYTRRNRKAAADAPAAEPVAAKPQRKERPVGENPMAGLKPADFWRDDI